MSEARPQAPVHASGGSPLFCTSCGKPLNAQDAFCKLCGARVGGQAAEKDKGETVASPLKVDEANDRPEDRAEVSGLKSRKEVQ